MVSTGEYIGISGSIREYQGVPGSTREYQGVSKRTYEDPRKGTQERAPKKEDPREPKSAKEYQKIEKVLIALKDFDNIVACI